MSERDTLRTYFRGAWELARAARGPSLGPARLERLRDRRLRRIVSHAYANVPRYRRLFDRAGVRPEAIRTAADLACLPITTKSELRKLSVGDLVMRGTDLARCLHPSTSGTSGEPFTVHWDAAGACIFYALTARALRMAGARVTDTLLVIGPGYYPQGLRIQRLGIGRVRCASPLQAPAAIADAINATRPDVLHAYASVLKSLVGHLRSTGTALHRPRVIVSSADYLDEVTRRECGALLGVEPVQMYGAVETGRLGSECLARDGIHLFTDFVVPELLPLGGEVDDPARRVVLTDLTNFTMPFLRYDQGDLAEALDGPCRCGSRFPRIRLVFARSSDVVRLPDGAAVSALRLGRTLWEAPGVERFRIAQTSPTRLVVEVVVEQSCDEAPIRAAVAQIGALLPGIETVFQRVASIAPSSTGKAVHFEPFRPLEEEQAALRNPTGP